ncbi:uncharacterized protein LOC110460852 [Mizuhopecten yessoensis]|nr:uncharacterized protein LOC110460852 [Mizuhopecten yessoensis]
MSSGRHVKLPALRIPSEPPKFKFRKRKITVKPIGDRGPPPSITSCDKIVDQEPQVEPQVVPEDKLQVDQLTHQHERYLPPIHKEPIDSKIPGLYGAYYSQCVCEKKSNPDPLNAAPPDINGAVGKMSATELLGGKFEQPVKYKHFAYGGNDWLHLLVTGQLPPEVLQAFMSKFCRAGKTLKAHGPQADKYFYYQGGRQRTKPLWEPKQMKLQQVYSQFDRKQLEASCRQKKNMLKLSKKAELMAKHNETVLLKKVDRMDSRLKSYLDKMDKNISKAHTDKNSNGNMANSFCKNDSVSHSCDTNLKSSYPKNPDMVKLPAVIAWVKTALSNLLSENNLDSDSSSTGNQAAEETNNSE